MNFLMLIQLDQFVVEDLQPIMVTDSGLSSHPMVADVETLTRSGFSGLSSHSEVAHLFI